MSAVRVYLLAGEHSGDALGGRLMAALKTHGSHFVFEGVGGPDMQAQGLSSFVPMEDLCVMGLVEVIKHYPRLRRLGYQIIDHIEETQPDVVVTIDLPDFNFQVAKILKKRGVYKGKIVHYVAPTVWAWRPGRAKKISKFLDGLMCLFPFEPDYFTRHGLDAAFVGHSMIESGMDQANGALFKKRYNIPENKKVAGVLFGSRVREVEALGPVFGEVMQAFPDIHFVVPTLPHLSALVEPFLSGNYTLVTEPEEKWNAFAACDGAMAVSGTVGLELAYMGVPHIIAYKTHPVTALLIKCLVKTKYAHLANILLDRKIIPEFLQKECHSKNIATELDKTLCHPQYQKDSFLVLRDAMGGQNPSQEAARFVLKNLI